MQAYEHIIAAALALNKEDTEEQILSTIKKLAAYFTLPDSVRALVGKTLGKRFRQPSHWTDGAKMQYIIGDELKNDEKYPKDKIFLQEGSETKAADGPTNIEFAYKANKELFNNTIEGKAIYLHLVQDTISDKFCQTDIAECYIDLPKGQDSISEKSVNLYGVQAKEGL